MEATLTPVEDITARIEVLEARRLEALSVVSGASYGSEAHRGAWAAQIRLNVEIGNLWKQRETLKGD